MDHQAASQQKVTAIVPAYNEAERISRVLSILTTHPLVSEVIVVDDGSTDQTQQIVETFPVKYLRIFQNQGKASAMELGVKQAAHDIIFFCDADISGLTHEIITEIVTPVMRGEVDMFVAMRNRKAYILSQIVTLVPLFGGERALRKELWNKIPPFYKHKFRIEAALNFYAKYYGKGFRIKLFRGLTQPIKERKYGFTSGFKQRISMMGDVLVSEIKLQFIDIPHTVYSARLKIGAIVSSASATVLGILILVGALIGPHEVIQRLFSEELREDPKAPLVHFLLRLTSQASTTILAIIGIGIIGINFVMLLLNARRLVWLLQTKKLSLKDLVKKVK